MPQQESAIEVTAHCPALMKQYKRSKISLEIDNARHELEWDQPKLFAVLPGQHRVRAGIQGLLMSGASRQLSVKVDPGEIAEVVYSLTMLSLVNPGKLEVKGRRGARSPKTVLYRGRRNLVFAFERRNEVLSVRDPVDFATPEETENMVIKLGNTIPMIAGAVGLSCTFDSETRKLVEFKVVKSVGEFDLAAVIDRLGQD
jgi:hypothetical protein